jgi:hypothetical protein
MRDRRHRALVPLIWLPAVGPKPCDSGGLGQLKHSWVIGCTRLTLIAWLSSKLDGRSHFLLRCSPKPKKYLWCVSKNQGYSSENSSFHGSW